MKELSIEEKAKRYDEVVERAKIEKEKSRNLGLLEFIDENFPELRESEDEKIRKELIYYFKENNAALAFKGISNDRILDWLKKQGEHKKFHDSIQIGDKVTRNKDGVLVNLSQLNRVAKKDEKQDEQKPYGQRQECLDCQFNYAGECKGSCAMKRGEQKPAWSEEDEKYTQGLIRGLKANRDIFKFTIFISDSDSLNITSTIDWLKSLKDRVLPKQEWSEEDKTNIDSLLDILYRIKKGKDPQATTRLIEQHINFIESLKERYTWKPSDEQMEALANALSLAKNCGEESAFELRTLYEQLEKLK